MMRWETGGAAVLAMLALQACAPEPPPEPKPSDGFLKPADQAFVNAAWTKVAATYDKPGTVQYQALTISEDAGERTLCGESAEPDQLWRGFVATRKVGETAFDVVRQDDQISPRAMKACKLLVRKYMGEKDVDTPEIQQAIVQNGCAYLDPVYWKAHKDRCYKTLTVAGGAPTPAPPP